MHYLMSVYSSLPGHPGTACLTTRRLITCRNAAPVAPVLPTRPGTPLRPKDPGEPGAPEHSISSKMFTKRLRGLWDITDPKRLQLLNLQSLEYRRISQDLMSVCLSVCLSVCHDVPVSDENGLTYRHIFFHHTVAQLF